MDSLAGRTIRWRFVDGPIPDVTFEHAFGEDGSVTWRIVDGEHQGASRREQPYAAVKVNEGAWAISYLSASGHTLTVVLNLDDRRAIGFGSDGRSWYPLTGSFEVVG
jgi:MoaF N-terminal domain